MLSRRGFVAGSIAGGVASRVCAQSDDATSTVLRLERRNIEVNGKSASSPCISVRGNSLSSGGVHFVLAEQQDIIPARSGRFAECRLICCDTVATKS
jgi:hypothetical protein